jgi:hypothetical protein
MGNSGDGELINHVPTDARPYRDWWWDDFVNEQYYRAGKSLRERARSCSMIQRILVKLAKRSNDKRRFSLPRLLYLMVMLGVFGLTIPMIAAPVYAASTPPATHASTPANAHDSCDTAACQAGSSYANGGSSDPNSGKLMIPYHTGNLLAFTDPNYTVNAPGIPQIWLGMVGVVDLFIAFMFVVNGIRIMMSGSIFRYADVAETVPRVILALITAHISFAIIGFFLGMSNTLCTSLLEYAGSIANPKTPISDMLGFGPINFTIWDAVTLGSQYITRIILEMCLFFVKLVMGLILVAQLVTRIILIDLYIIFSAPCIACSALPGRSGQPVTRMWLQGFLSLAFVQLVQVAGLIVAEMVMSFLNDAIFNIMTDFVPSWLKFSAADTKIIVTSFMGIIILWFILKVPSLLQAAPMQTMAAGGRMAGAMVTSAVSGTVSVVGAAAILAK